MNQCWFSQEGKRGAVDRASDSEYMNGCPAWVRARLVPQMCELLVPLSKALYSNCSVVQRSRKAVGPVYMYLNINTSVHVKERHRLFEKSRGSSRYCWLYFKHTFIYSRTRGKVQLVCTQCVNTQAYEVSTNNGRRRALSLLCVICTSSVYVWIFVQILGFTSNLNPALHLASSKRCTSKLLQDTVSPINKSNYGGQQNPVARNKPAKFACALEELITHKQATQHRWPLSRVTTNHRPVCMLAWGTLHQALKDIPI